MFTTVVYWIKMDINKRAFHSKKGVLINIYIQKEKLTSEKSEDENLTTIDEHYILKGC